MANNEGEVKVVITGEAGTVTDAAQKSVDAISEVGKEVEKSTEKFMSNRREVRAIGNEIAETFGLGRIGGLLVGGVFATVVAATKSIEFLKDTWNGLKETINGPVDIGLPPDAASKISTVAEAWKDYAEARAKVIAGESSPESTAGAREKSLSNEEKLLKDALEGKKEDPAIAALEKEFRRRQLSNKYDEAANLEIDSRNKTAQALGIKGAPRDVAEANEKYYDEQSAKAQRALADINERIAFIHRVANPEDHSEYSGPWGSVSKKWDRFKYYQRYGGTSADFAGNLQSEELRKAQLEAIISASGNYKTREDDAQKTREDLMKSAGLESGKATSIRDSANNEAALESLKTLSDLAAATHKTHAQQEAILRGILDHTLNHGTVLQQLQWQLNHQAGQISNMRNRASG
jgi:hypothetical protein